MPAQEQDYIVRHIQTISRLIARLRRQGRILGEEDRAELNETLLLALHLQEKNFGMPADRFLGLSADAQFDALMRGESPVTGQARCLTYATLLRETAELYAYRGSTDLALGARQLALYFALRVALDRPAAANARTLVEALRLILGEAELYPPTQALLRQYDLAAS